MKKPRVLIIRAAGINCDMETANGFKMAGARPEMVHISRIKSGKVRLKDYSILVFPGGFSYGDDIAAGKILASQVNRYLLRELAGFINGGRPVIGICNGFQVLVKTGFLPYSTNCEQTAGFTNNDSGLFVSRWVRLRVNTKKPCLFTKGLPEIIELPVAHGEGKLVLKSSGMIDKLEKNNSIAMRYIDNPNGSVSDIAALTNPKGNCLGLMPHPERYLSPFHHPNWTRSIPNSGPIGLQMFQNAVRYVR